MTRYFAFNGDADGLCALQQLRLTEPQPGALITGVKRDIALLKYIRAQTGDAVTVLDVSLLDNHGDLLRLLESGTSVRYFDHHYAGAIPEHPHLDAHIDESADVCTSILVDRYIGGRHRGWAVVAAFGDNLPGPARVLAQQTGLTADATTDLQKLGVCLNYNAYGDSVEDLHFHPAELAARMLPFSDPLAFINDTTIYPKLRSGYEEDMAKARVAAQRGYATNCGIIVLPNEAWARRAIGVLTNELAQKRPQAALAILSPKASGGFTVSVRVPADSPVSAAEFCGNFATGGGRKLAGGINYLPEADLDQFATRFEARFRTR
jgi:hypothetical protein